MVTHKKNKTSPKMQTDKEMKTHYGNNLSPKCITKYKYST